MNILKHGKYFNKKEQRFELIGKCETCGCEFKTYSIIRKGVPKEEDYLVITDTDGIEIKPKLHFFYGDDDYSHFVIGKDTLDYETIPGPRVFDSVDFSCKCPECISNVELKIIDELKSQ